MAASNYAAANATNNIHGLGNDTTSPKEKKSPDSLFGPNIGVISSGPSWTSAADKNKMLLKDELTMDIVKSWIEKSKEPSQPTTTLQALVNLKRPTLRLSPIQDAEHDHAHALEFEFDCDAPKCGIYVNVLLPPGHPEGMPPPPDAEANAKPRYTKVLVFESIVEGGFGKTLKLEDGAVLELGRYELSPTAATKAAATTVTTPPTAAEEPQIQPDSAANEAPANDSRHNHSRRRITHFFHRRRHDNNNNNSVSGPPLAVVDASSPSPSAETEAKEQKKKDDDGVKVTIRLAALDDQGTELHSPNEQVTYLCVERFGAKQEAPKTEGEGEGETQEQKKEEEHDTRPWVVKVVKREATIGPHTFQLHEIYGLTSSSHPTSTTPLPQAQPPTPNPNQHTYPPQPTTAPITTEEEDPTSECLLCLSSPREVVLLPCRHLVACKECALNMVEFGAGGAITQTTAAADNTEGGEGAVEGGDGNANATTTNAGTTTTTPATNTRRKRKAKGWFCPVCRQPYTSLLRITTNPPPESAKGQNEGERTSGDGEEGEDQEQEQDVTEQGAGLPLPVTTPNNSGNGGGGVGGFFRSLTGRNTAAA
ncbi:hydroxyproline-rich glycoprotein [Moniliophthora roreri]|nr:hydroxyproline-rich glycoprotein [Moniliophthora roreri]